MNEITIIVIALQMEIAFLVFIFSIVIMSLQNKVTELLKKSKGSESETSENAELPHGIEVDGFGIVRHPSAEELEKKKQPKIVKDTDQAMEKTFDAILNNE